MGKTLIGNFKGPKGDKGDPGPQGPMGPQGPVGLVNTDGAVEFEDYTSEGAELPAPVDALAMITSGQKLKNIFSGIRAFCKNMLDSELGSGKMIGDAFSEEKTYAAGEYAIYDNALYEFTAAKAVGPWDPDVAALTTIAEVMRELNGNMMTAGNMININEINSKCFGTIVKFQKVVIVTGIANYAVKAGADIITLPYRPISQINYRGSSASQSGSSPLVLDATGTIKSGSSGEINGWNFSISYVTND